MESLLVNIISEIYDRCNCLQLVLASKICASTSIIGAYKMRSCPFYKVLLHSLIVCDEDLFDYFCIHYEDFYKSMTADQFDEYEYKQICRYMIKTRDNIRINYLLSKTLRGAFSLVYDYYVNNELDEYNWYLTKIVQYYESTKNLYWMAFNMEDIDFIKDNLHRTGRIDDADNIFRYSCEYYKSYEHMDLLIDHITKPGEAIFYILTRRRHFTDTTDSIKLIQRILLTYKNIDTSDALYVCSNIKDITRHYLSSDTDQISKYHQVLEQLIKISTKDHLNKALQNILCNQNHKHISDHLYTFIRACEQYSNIKLVIE